MKTDKYYISLLLKNRYDLKLPPNEVRLLYEALVCENVQRISLQKGPKMEATPYPILPPTHLNCSVYHELERQRAEIAVIHAQENLDRATDTKDIDRWGTLLESAIMRSTGLKQIVLAEKQFITLSYPKLHIPIVIYDTMIFIPPV